MSGTCSDIGGDVNNKRKLIGNSEYVYTITERTQRMDLKIYIGDGQLNYI